VKDVFISEHALKQRRAPKKRKKKKFNAQNLCAYFSLKKANENIGAGAAASS
jgi:hypothetical protein